MSFNEDNIIQMADKHPEVHEFLDPLIAGIAGAYIGHKLDQTRFGVWFNTNPVVTSILHLLRLLFIGFVIYCACLFIYFVATG